MLNHSFAALLSFTLIFCIIFLVTRKKAGALHYDETAADPGGCV